MPIPAAPGSTPSPDAEAPIEAPPQNAPTKQKKQKAASWGKGAGEDAIPVPSTFGAQNVDLIATFNNLHSAIESSVADIPGFIAAFETMGKDKFPGNKYGRTAYDVARMVKIISNGKDRLAGKTTGGRPSKVAALQSQLEQLMSILTPEQLAALQNQG